MPNKVRCLPIINTNSGKNYLNAKMGKDIVSLCCLELGKQENFSMDIYVKVFQEVEFLVTGANEIHLSGYWEPMQDVFDEDDDDVGVLGRQGVLTSGNMPMNDSDSDDEEEEMDAAEVKKLQQAKANAQKNSSITERTIKAAQGKAVESDEEEEESEEDLEVGEEDDDEDSEEEAIQEMLKKKGAKVEDSEDSEDEDLKAFQNIKKSKKAEEVKGAQQKGKQQKQAKKKAQIEMDSEEEEDDDDDEALPTFK